MGTDGVDRKRRLTLAATILGSSLAFIDATVVIVALPTIEEDLDLGLTGQQWIFLSYSLALAALYLVGGALGDRYGRRTVFVAGAAGFALASVLAGVSANGSMLIVARALQGVAGAFLTTNSLALLRGVYGAEAGRAIGLWTSFTSVATITGPPLGGALVEWVSAGPGVRPHRREVPEDRHDLVRPVDDRGPLARGEDLRRHGPEVLGFLAALLRDVA